MESAFGHSGTFLDIAGPGINLIAVLEIRHS